MAKGGFEIGNLKGEIKFGKGWIRPGVASSRLFGVLKGNP